METPDKQRKFSISGWLRRWQLLRKYKPEQHYMRGSRTASPDSKK